LAWLQGESSKSSLIDSRLTLEYKLSDRPTVRRYYALNSLSPENELGINNGDVDTCARALLERMYYCKIGDKFVEPPQLTLGEVNAKLSVVKQRFTKCLFEADRVRTQEFVELYNGPLRKRYEDAAERIWLNPQFDERCAWSNTFVKVEKVNLSKAPRVIQPREPVYNLRLGRFLKAIEHRVYKKLGKLFGDGPTVMKGYTTNQVANIIKGKWESFSNPVGVGLDATKFDMHVSKGMLQFEHSFYHHIFRNSKHYGALRELLRLQLDNHGVALCPDGTITYDVSGRRLSGDMNTALGNCIIMCCMIWQYAYDKQVSVKLVNNGDDCVVFMEKEDLSRFSDGLHEWFLECGFRMTQELPVSTLEHVEFCQMRPVMVANGKYNMCRDPSKVFTKDTMAINCQNVTEVKAWMGSVGVGGSAMYADMPILGAFYRHYMLNGTVSGKAYKKYASVRGNWLYHWKSEIPVGTQVLQETRVSFWEAFGITPDRQIAMEQELSKHVLDWNVISQVKNYNQAFNFSRDDYD
jgi:hypothetical protein